MLTSGWKLLSLSPLPPGVGTQTDAMYHTPHHERSESDASADWRAEYEYQSVETDLTLACEAPDCERTTDLEPVNSDGDRRVLCRGHRKEVFRITS